MLEGTKLFLGKQVSSTENAFIHQKTSKRDTHYGFHVTLLAGFGLASPKAKVVIPKIISSQNHLRKKTSNSAKYRLPLCYKKDPLK